MSWQILLSSYNCVYHENKGDSYCDLLSSHICKEAECPMKAKKKYVEMIGEQNEKSRTD